MSKKAFYGCSSSEAQTERSTIKAQLYIGAYARRS